jgi:hypothetical protein
MQAVNIGEALAPLARLRRLDVSHTAFGDQDCAIMASSKAGGLELEDLDVSGTQVRNVAPLAKYSRMYFN